MSPMFNYLRFADPKAAGLFAECYLMARLRREWEKFIIAMEYTYEVERMRIAFSAPAPLLLHSDGSVEPMIRVSDILHCF